MAVIRRQEEREVLACTHAMAVLELRLVAVSLLAMLLLVAVQAARALARLLELLAV